MKLIFGLLFICLCSSLLSQQHDPKDWCKIEFWRSVDTTHLDTLTIFNDHSICIKQLPERIYDLTNLRELILDTEVSLESLSPRVKELKNLEVLVIQKSKLKQLPSEICELKRLKKLTIAWGGQLKKLPENIGQLENLEYLDLYRNDLTSLPHSMKDLKNLKRLILGENNFSKSEQAKISAMLPNCKVSFSYDY